MSHQAPKGRQLIPPALEHQGWFTTIQTNNHDLSGLLFLQEIKQGSILPYLNDERRLRVVPRNDEEGESIPDSQVRVSPHAFISHRSSLALFSGLT